MRPGDPPPRRIRVALLSKALVVGAYQRKAEEIAALGVDLTVLAPATWSEAGRVQRLERAYTSGYTLRALPIVLDGHFHTHFYPTLGREIDRIQPDLLHVDEEPYNLATFLAYLQGRSAHRVFFTWQNLMQRYPPPFRWMEHYVLRASAAAIAGNSAASEVLRSKGYRGTVAIIPQFGFDPDLFSPLPDRPARPFTIGYVGRFEEHKGVLDLAEACAGLTGDWRLAYVGGGPAEKRLRSVVETLGTADRVSISGFVPSREVPGVMRGLDAIVLASHTTPRWMEQFGRVLVEGMACGAAAVGSSSGEIPSVIGEAGLIFPERDVAALRAHLQRLIDDPGLRADLARRGRERFLANYTMAAVARATVDVYQKALKTSRASASD